MHTTAYALIALQEMNLAYKYPIIYWNCACLSVDSSAINGADFYNLVDDDFGWAIANGTEHEMLYLKRKIENA